VLYKVYTAVHCLQCCTRLMCYAQFSVLYIVYSAVHSLHCFSMVTVLYTVIGLQRFTRFTVLYMVYTALYCLQCCTGSYCFTLFTVYFRYEAESWLIIPAQCCAQCSELYCYSANITLMIICMLLFYHQLSLLSCGILGFCHKNEVMCA
jgi:hypothetical protein